MDAYFPNSVFLNNIYTPFYSLPKKNSFKINQNFSIEIDQNGTQSIINLRNDEETIIPFIDRSDYDSETRSWFWFDSNGFPFRIGYIEGSSNLTLTSIYDFGTYYNKSIIINPNDLKKESGGKKLGFYTIATVDGNKIDDRFYTGSPIILEIGSEIITDLTDYYNFQSNIILTQINPEANKEFYFDAGSNKIFTNQTLNLFDPSQIILNFYTTNNSVNVKCRLKNNKGMNNFSTPIVDYYVAKLHGQYLKV